MGIIKLNNQIKRGELKMANKYDSILDGLTYYELIIMKIINDNIKIDEDVKEKIDDVLVRKIDKMRYSMT